MTNSEIRALAEQTREKIIRYGNGYHMPAAPLCIALETLLARQAEVLEKLAPPSSFLDSTNDYEYGRSFMSDEIRAILDPQEPRS